MSSDDNVRSLFSDNRVQMAEVIAGLLQMKTPTEVAEALGIPRSRITRWYRESEEFQEMLADVTEEVVASIRALIVEEQTDAVVNMLPLAKKVLYDVLNEDSEAPASVKVTAAAHVFRLAGYDGKHAMREEARPPSPTDEVRKVAEFRPNQGD